MPDIYVQSFTHLKDKPNADRALHMLQRIASLVKPIQRKRNWVLPVLAEFFPENPSLLGLNVNMGQKILVRLRPAHSPDSFYEEADVVQTMLHELTHNVHGPHDEKFYKYLAGLQDEYDALQRSGYAGEGFFSEGKRLGANVSHNLPPHLARARALAAAEKRQQGVLGGGGARLGGRIGTVGLTPREMAARAAERRARDEKACGSGVDAEREAAKAAKESVENKVIDLTLDESSDDEVMVVDEKPILKAGPSKAGNIQQRGTSSAVPTTRTKKQLTTSMSDASLNKPTRAAPPIVPKVVLDEWSCPACTLLNPTTALQCDVCTMRRPPDERVGWSCLTCGESGMPHEFWTCRFCGVMKLES